MPVGRSVLESGLDLVDAAVANAIVAIMAVMVAIVATQVGLRYGFNSSIDWADEISRLCFVWSIFLAIPLGIKRGAHIGIELLVARLPAAGRDMLYRAMAVLSMLLMGLVGYEAFKLTLDQWDEPMPTVEASVALFMLPVGLGATHSLLHLFRLVIRGEPAREAIAE
ncbi:MAG: TRAP transporter small permease [Pseudomonadota bacterium]